jgi:hypothetical protein
MTATQTYSNGQIANAWIAQPAPAFQFERYTPARQGGRAGLQNTVVMPKANNNQAYISGDLLEAIGSPTYVELYWDATQRVMGIAPAAPDAWHPLKVSYAGRERRQAGVSTIGFQKRYGIPYGDHSVQVFAEVLDGMIVAYLNRPIN